MSQALSVELLLFDYSNQPPPTVRIFALKLGYLNLFLVHPGVVSIYEDTRLFDQASKSQHFRFERVCYMKFKIL